MRRLTILMIEIEQPEGLTSRKLVAETMKHNVLTAYSIDEGLELLEANTIHLVLVHTLLPGGAEKAMQKVREIAPETPILQILPNLVPNAHQQKKSPLADEAVFSDELDRFYNYLDALSEKVLGDRPADYSETRVEPAVQQASVSPAADHEEK